MKHLVFVAAITILLIYLLPIVIQQENSHIRIHDNLNDEFVYRHLLVETGKVFELNPQSPVDNVMNGLPRVSFPSGFNFVFVLFALFGSFNGYVINHVIVHLIGFLGMFLLLKKHFLKDDNHLIINLGVSLCFSILPVFSIYGISVMGQPLLLYAFLNILSNKSKPADFLIIVFFGFYSLLVYAGVFVIIALLSMFLFFWIKNKKINYKFLAGITVLTITYIFVEYNLINAILFSNNFISHRTEYVVFANCLEADTFATLNYKGVIAITFFNFINGTWHSANYNGYILLPVIISSILIGYFMKKDIRLIIAVLSITFLVAFVMTVQDWQGMEFLYKKISFFNMFNARRIFFLLPFLIYLTFGLSLPHFLKIKYGNRIIIPVFIILISFTFIGNINFERSGFLNNGLELINSNKRFKQYFSKELFKGIKEYINKPQKSYKVVNLGIDPAIAQYNGFFTLDSYQGIYLLEYKHKFRRIIEKELDKSNKLKIFFDKSNGAGECYLYSAEVFENKAENYKIKNLDINTDVLKEMGCEFIFSTYQILNSDEIDLKLDRMFENDTWKIYLYKIDMI